MFLGDLKTLISLKLLQNMLKDVSQGRPWDFFSTWRSLLLRMVPAVWQKTVYIGYDSMFFGDLKTLISLKLLQNMLKDVSQGRPWDFFQDLTVNFIASYIACVTHNSLYCIYFNVYYQLVDVNQFKTVTKYVAGRLIRTSLGLFSGLGDHFYCARCRLYGKKQSILDMIQCFWEI